MNKDNSNQVTIYAGSGVSGPRWIQGTDSISLGAYLDYIFKKMEISIVDGEVVPGDVEIPFYSPNPTSPVGTGGGMAGRSLFTESQTTFLAVIEKINPGQESRL
jgi:hypothetical protein